MSESESEGESHEPAQIAPSRRILGGIKQITNIDLLDDAISEIKMVDWPRLSLTTFYIGVLGLICWSLYFALIFSAQFVISSNGVITGFSRAVSVGPTSIIALWVFAGLARWTAQGIDSTHQDGPTAMSKIDGVKISGVSVISLFGALITRSLLFTTEARMFTPPLTELEVISILVVDGSWISLLLIGIGGLASVLLTPVE